MSVKSIPKKLAILGVAAVAVALVAMALVRPSATPHPSAHAHLATYSVERGTLVIDVLEAGSIDASQSQIIKSQVEGRTTIISIVPEGTILAEEDVANERVLVELDSSALRDELNEEEISLQSSLATLRDAEESYSIQVNQNESNLKQGELAKEFFWMDLEKFLGVQVAALFRDDQVDLNDLAAHEELGGEALQTLRELENNKLLEEEELAQARDKLYWTEILEASGYVSANVLDEDRLAMKRAEVALAKAQTAIDLFLRYEIKRQAKQFLSDYLEASRELERIAAKNRSELARADAQLKSSSATYYRRLEDVREVRDQISKTRIVATQPGLVTYPDNRRDRERAIEEGAEVYEQQELIRIPNLANMIAKTKIHESVVARIKEGQKAVVTLDALPDHSITGVVRKVGILPDSQDRWMNPDLKVYETEVTLNERIADLKPGMSSQVRIVIDELEDVLKIPLQSVVTKKGSNFCFVLANGAPQLTVIETGSYNDNFVEVKKGLEEGQQVVLNVSSLMTQFQEEINQRSQSGAGENEGMGRENRGPRAGREGGERGGRSERGQGREQSERGEEEPAPENEDQRKPAEEGDEPVASVPAVEGKEPL